MAVVDPLRKLVSQRFWIKRLEGSTLLSLSEELPVGVAVGQSVQAWRVPDPFPKLEKEPTEGSC